MTPTLDELAGGDPVMANITDLCRKISDKDLPLLILGDTGVGKDSLARALHASGSRAGKPFISINCAAIPASLLASELFGYAPGAFTDGAKNGYAGKLVACNGGTFFLDEIGDMPLDLQAYLLRVLEERSVSPLGSNKAIPIDVRFISATHCDLAALVRRGRFRQDLYFRVRGVQVKLPALRERLDLGELIDLFVAQEAQAQKLDITLCPKARDVLCRYDWPGNIRELKSILRVTISTCDGHHVTVTHLPSPLIEFARMRLSIDGRCSC